MRAEEPVDVRERAGGDAGAAPEVAPASPPGLAAVALRLQRSAGNRSTAAWAAAAAGRLERKAKVKPRPKDPFDTVVAAGGLTNPAEALSGVPLGGVDEANKKPKGKRSGPLGH